MVNLEVLLKNCIIFTLGAMVALLIMCAVLLANMEPCIKCGTLCKDTDNYCRECGQQLRITK